jgi:transposase
MHGIIRHSVLTSNARTSTSRLPGIGSSRDRGCRARADPRQALQESSDAKEWLPKHLEANDDLTLEEHRQAFEEEFGQRVSTSTIGRAISGLPDGGWPLKKVTDSSRRA